MATNIVAFETAPFNRQYSDLESKPSHALLVGVNFVYALCLSSLVAEEEAFVACRLLLFANTCTSKRCRKLVKWSV